MDSGFVVKMDEVFQGTHESPKNISKYVTMAEAETIKMLAPMLFAQISYS